MEAEFPDLLREKASAAAAIGASPNVGQQRDQRASHPPGERPMQQQQDSKNKLSIYAQVLQETNLLKGDIVYDVNEAQDTSGAIGFQATVRIPESPLISNNIWSGELCRDRKEAEFSAAHYALEELTPICQPMFEEKRALKRQREQERAEEKRRKIEEEGAEGTT